MGSGMDRMQRMALKQAEELLRNPGYQAAMRHLEEMERNPALKMLYRQTEEQARSPLFHVSRQVMRDLDRLTAHEHLRAWEQRIPDWVLNARRHSTPGLDLIFGNFMEIERLRASLPGFGTRGRVVEDISRIGRESVRRVEMGGLVGPRDWARLLDLSRQFSDVFRSLPPEVSDTYLGQAARRLEAIRESAESQDPEKFDQEVDALADHLLGWVRILLPHKLTSEGMLSILIGILLAVAQTGLSYKWRLYDHRDAQHREQAIEKKLDERFGAVLSAILERRQDQAPDAGKTYRIERTTAVFSRPGPKRPRVGYVYAGQRVRAVATTGRWIFIEYADPFNLELRAGWIRKKYANLVSTAAKTPPTITALRAQGAANLFLSDHLGDRFLAVRPQLDESGGLWRVPVVLTYAVVGPVGEVGEVTVSAGSEEIVSHTPVEEMKERARTLYEQHREKIDAPLP